MDSKQYTALESLGLLLTYFCIDISSYTSTFSQKVGIFLHIGLRTSLTSLHLYIHWQQFLGWYLLTLSQKASSLTIKSLAYVCRTHSWSDGSSSSSGIPSSQSSCSLAAADALLAYCLSSSTSFSCFLQNFLTDDRLIINQNLMAHAFAAFLCLRQTSPRYQSCFSKQVSQISFNWQFFCPFQKMISLSSQIKSWNTLSRVGSIAFINSSYLTAFMTSLSLCTVISSQSSAGFHMRSAFPIAQV